MEENKVKLTEEKEKELKIKLINYLLLFKEKNNKDYREGTDLYKTFNCYDYQNTNKKRDDSSNWWKDGDYYDQKAHIIMYLLSKTKLPNSGTIKNKGFIFLLKYVVNKDNESISDDEEINLKKFFKNNIVNIENLQKEISQNNMTNTLLDYVELYFSKPSNFKYYNKKLDYLNLNEPILNNLYNWYYNELKKPDEINTYCNKLENIINNMEQLLTREENTTIQKCNIICTIAKTKIIIHDLINSQNNIDKEQTQLENIKSFVKKNDDYRTAADEFMKKYEESSH